MATTSGTAGLGPETTRLGSTGTTGIAGLGSAGLWAWDQPPLPGE